MSTTSTTTTPTASIGERLAAARRELELAEADELRAFQAVSDGREAAALGEISRRQLLSLQRDLSDCQEGTEAKKAAVRALSRLQVQQAEAASAAETRARAERDAAARKSAAEAEARIAARVSAIADELDQMAAEARSSVSGWSPGTDANRRVAWGEAVAGIASLRRVYPSTR